MAQTKQETSGRPGDEDRRPIVERRLQRRWVPALAGWLSFLLGLQDIAGALLPEWHRRMVRIDEIVPGAVNDAARIATLVAGLLLLLLSHGLRSRKRRAWRAVVGLLALTTVSHVVKDFELSALVALVMLGVLVYFRTEFYATGDPRTRWRALWVGLFLAVTSVAFGLLFIVINSGALDHHYSFYDSLKHVVIGMFGATGPVRFASDRRNDLFSLFLGVAGPVHRPGHGLPVPAAGRARAVAVGRRRGADPAAAGHPGLPRLPRLLLAAPRQERHLVAHRQGLHHVPGGVRA